MKKSSKIRKSIALMIVSVFSFSVVAYADNAYVSGELNRSGSLVQYDYVRTHTFDGPISCPWIKCQLVIYGWGFAI